MPSGDSGSQDWLGKEEWVGEVGWNGCVATRSIGQLQPGATLLPGRAENSVLKLGTGVLDCMLLQVVGSSSLPQLFLQQEIREESFKFFLLVFEKGAVGNYLNSCFSFYFSFFSPFIEELVR